MRRRTPISAKDSVSSASVWEVESLRGSTLAPALFLAELSRLALFRKSCMVVTGRCLNETELRGEVLKNKLGGSKIHNGPTSNEAKKD